MRRLRISGPIALLATLLCASVSMSTASASTSYTPTEAEANKLSLEQARNTVINGFNACRSGVTSRVQVLPDVITVSRSNNLFFVVQFREMHDINLTYTSTSFWTSSPSSFVIRYSGHTFIRGKDFPNYEWFCELGEDWAKLLGDAMLRLKLEYDRANSPEAIAQCADEARRYQAMNPRPELPEGARRFRVQAEAAVAAKRFADAANGYLEGIKVAPWWPEGHYNRAVILAELQSFDSATTEMKCYLALKPDAPDARQAQDLIYVWETRPYVDK